MPVTMSSGKNVFEELGPDYTLLAFDAEPVDVETMLEDARALELPVQLVRDTRHGERAEYGTKMVLVRPDQYVSWAGDTVPRDSRHMLERVTGATSRSRVGA
jgi:uncharacterized metal-binding protein YceD (DUF177 family)